MRWAWILLLALFASAQQPVNVATVAGTAPTTAGKVDVKAADGDVTVRCSSGTNCPVNATLSAETSKVIGTVNQGGAPWAQRIQDGVGATLATVTAGNALKVDGSAVTQPVSGTVTANAGTGTLAVDPTDRAARLVGQVEGRAASGAAKAGNPNQVGYVFNTTQPTVTTGQSVEAQGTARGAAIVATGADIFNVTVNAALPAGTNVIGALSANQSVNVAQIAGAATATAASGVQKVGVTGNAGAVFDAATGAAPPANAILAGGLVSGATGGFVGAIPVCDSYANINISTATTTLIVTGVTGRQVRICALHLVTAAANNVAAIEGTGATCATGTAGMAGGTTAASGWNFAANSGLALGGGIGTAIRTATSGDSVCLVTSAATQLSGGVSYTIY